MLKNINRLVEFIIFLSLVVIVALYSLRSLDRYFGISFINSSGYPEIVSLASIWVYFLGMAVATRYSQHIAGGIDAFINHEKISRMIQILSLTVLLIFSLVSLYYWALLAIQAHTRGTTSLLLGIPNYVKLLGVNLGFLLSAIYAAIALINSIKIKNKET